MRPLSDAGESVPGLLSIVIPIGGVDRFLDEAVGSALADPTIDREVIAVFNNGARPPADWPFAADPRVRVLHDPAPLGPAGAGQLGIDAARGEYLVCLDADDRMRPGRLAAQLAWMTAHPETVLVSSQVDWIDEDGARRGGFRLPAGPDVRARLLAENVAPHSAWMARMTTVRAAGGYDLTMEQMEDYDLLLRLGLLGEIAVLPETLTEYRLHAAQLSRAVRPDGRYIGIIAARRRALGAALGVPARRVAAARAWWEAQQWFMYLARRVRG